MTVILPYASAAASGLLISLALPLAFPIGSIGELDPAGYLEVIAWVGLVPAILSVRGARTWVGALGRGLAAGFVSAFAALHWLTHAMSTIGALQPLLALLVLAVIALSVAFFWAVAFAISWKIWNALEWPLLIHLPCVWAALEFARNSVLPGTDLGYTQVRTVPVAQLAALAGTYGISALVVVVNALIAEAIAACLERRAIPWRSVAATAMLVAAVFVYGGWRMNQLRERMAAAPSLKVGIVQPNIDQSTKNAAAREPEWFYSKLVPLTVEADRAGADLVLWPESALPRYVPSRTRSFLGWESRIPPLRRAHLLLGALEVEYSGGARRGEQLPRIANAGILLSPTLDVRGSVRKHRLVPLGEYVPLQQVFRTVKPLAKAMGPMEPGHEFGVLEFIPTSASAVTPPMSISSAFTLDAPRAREAVRIATMICFDAVFPDIAIKLSRNDPNLIVNLTNDAWFGYTSGPYRSLAVTRMRAIETGKAIARAAYAGISAIILPTGEVAPGALELGCAEPAKCATGETPPPRLLIADVPLVRGRTVYTRIGDLFAWSCAVFTAAALGLALLRARGSHASGVRVPKTRTTRTEGRSLGS